MADTITIYSADEQTSVTLPRCRPKIGMKEVAISKEMASGKIVKDVIGMRKTISASYGYVPAADIVTLNTIVAEGGFHKVTYPGIGGDETGYFSIPQIGYTAFKFVNGTAMWSDVKLALEAQGVT